ncbi:MAG: molecular chaperone HtpG [Verrucomicrobiaceae bacterium]|nr:molecular chaperone HtpG [Verrucomicrobiaceae bacterium]
MTEESEDKHEFQAEVQQLLDIVINSLYTDKEIFVRELVSNAVDALEKLRHLKLTEKTVADPDLDLEINITTDETANTITIADYGTGMTREELIGNLGTIAHSGSKDFLNALSKSDQKETNIIGQFGVGFYSAFMVSDDVTVYTRSWNEDSEHLCWKSDGKTGYQIDTSSGERRGTKIVIQLKDEHEEFAKTARIKGILENYSNFVPFAILLDGERVNTVEAIWMKPKSDVSDEAYSEFYKFTAKAFDEPRYRMHFSADAPLMINSLLFVPGENPERPGFGQVEPGVSLYCNKVLIDSTPKSLLPDWLRFLKGVIDSEDLPLNISRESMQDSALVQKLNRLITKRFIKFLDREAKSDAEQFGSFYENFRSFLKEGVITDLENRDELLKLLRFESSVEEPGAFATLDDYVTRMKEDQDKIFYQVAPDRQTIESAPYVEAFKARGIEVLFLYDPIDEYLVGALPSYAEKQLVSIAQSGIELADINDEAQDVDADQASALCEWIKDALGDRVAEVNVSKRLVDSPAAALTPGGSMSPQMKQMMRQVDPEFSSGKEVHLEINPRHKLLKNLDSARTSQPEFAKLVAEQIADNALLAAGLLEEGRDMVSRVYEIMQQSLEK